MSLSDLRACCGSRYVRSPMSAGIGFMCAAISLSLALPPSLPDQGDVPKFGESIQNVTIPVGREAVLSCVVDDLSTYKVAWLRVDTQTILTIHGHVITKNHRIGVTHSDHRSWYLHIRDVRQTDRGWYMCQINTDPMKSQTGFLEVVVPPDILDYPTSTDMVVREGSNVTMRCAASGSPTPSITWRREDSVTIPVGSGQEVTSIEGPVFNITRVNRLHMGAYLCIASNGVPPTVSKRIMLIVHFPPMIWIQNQLVGASDGQQMTLECHSEAYPKSINYWTREKGEIISHGEKYEPELIDNAYKVHMKLTIRSVSSADYGAYKCVSKNSLGDTDGSIKLYKIPVPTTATTTVETTQLSLTFKKEVLSGQKTKYRTPAPTNQDVNDIALIPAGISHTQEHKIKEMESFNRMHKPTTDQSRSSEGSSHILVRQTDTLLLILVMSTFVSLLTFLRQII